LGSASPWSLWNDGHRLALYRGRSYTPAAGLFERTQNTYVRDVTRDTGCRFIDTLFPHPYVAFVHHANPPCGIFWVNNVCLYGPDFPSPSPETITLSF